MSIARVPFLIASLVGVHVTLTAPAPPLLEHESMAKVEGPVRIVHAVPVTKYFFWALTISEAIVIIAYNIPWFPVSRQVVKNLMPGNNAESLQLTIISALGALICACGGMIRQQCYRTMGRQFTFELSIREEHKLVTGGPYSIVRHPGYSGVIVALMGAALMHAPHGSWLRESGILGNHAGVLVVSIVATMTMTALGSLMWRMPREDGALSKEFGQAWEQWAERVPYALIPGVY